MANKKQISLYENGRRMERPYTEKILLNSNFLIL